MLDSACPRTGVRPHPVPNAGYYRVRISADQQLTNVVTTVTVNGTQYRPNSALPDSQAGSAYFWHVQPCLAKDNSSDHRCRALEHAEHGFEKFSNRVELIAPAPGATVADDVTLEWRDYVATNAANLPAGLGSPARIEADRYRVQVATDDGFANVIETAVVDQTQFTSYANTYPEGPLWWRVQAIDASGNELPWSADSGAARKMVKRSPVPQLQVPAEGSESDGVHLAWNALPFAASYEVEVYKSEDRGANPANRVVATTTRQRAIALATPLAASALPYVWRIRRIDAKGRKGDWSAWSSFSVSGFQPQLASPESGVRVPPQRVRVPGSGGV